jgi:hypothetical protein
MMREEEGEEKTEREREREREGRETLCRRLNFTLVEKLVKFF